MPDEGKGRHVFPGGSFKLVVSEGEIPLPEDNPATVRMVAKAESICQEIVERSPRRFRSKGATTHYEEGGDINADEIAFDYKLEVDFDGLNVPTMVLASAFAGLDDQMRIEIIIATTPTDLLEQLMAYREGLVVVSFEFD